MKIKKSSITKLFVFALYFMPYYLTALNINVRKNIYIIQSLVSVYYILAVLFRCRIKKFNNDIFRFWILVGGFYIVLIISTLNNNGPLQELLAQTITAIGASAVAIYYFYSDKALSSLNILIFWLELCTIINLLTVLAFPDGIYRTYGYENTYSNPAYFFGHRNNAIEVLLPLIGLTSYKDLFLGRKISVNYIFVVLISVLTSILTWSANEILCLSMIIIIDILYLCGIKLSSLKVWNIFVGFLILTLFITAFDGLKYFFPFFEKVLHKSFTVSERARIWVRTILAIHKKPILGYGVESYAVKFQRIGHSNSAHNYFLDYLYYGGILLLIVVELMVLLINKKTQEQENQIKVKISTIFLSYFILWLGSPIHRAQLFFMFTFMMITICLPWNKIKNQSILNMN